MVGSHLGCSEGRLAGLVWGFLTLTLVLELLMREEKSACPSSLGPQEPATTG